MNFQNFANVITKPKFYGDCYSYTGIRQSESWMNASADMAKSLLDLGILYNLFKNYKNWKYYENKHVNYIFEKDEEIINKIYSNKFNDKHGHSGASESYCLVSVIRRGYQWWKTMMRWKKVRMGCHIIGLYLSFIERYYEPNGKGAEKALINFRKKINT